MAAQGGVDLLVELERAPPVGVARRLARLLGRLLASQAAGVGIDGNDLRRIRRGRIADRDERGQAGEREGDPAIGGAGQIVGDDRHVGHGCTAAAGAGVGARPCIRRYHQAVTMGTRMAVTTTLVATSTVALAAAGL